jgi:hypothetical protein
VGRDETALTRLTFGSQAAKPRYFGRVVRKLEAFV